MNQQKTDIKHKADQAEPQFIKTNDQRHQHEYGSDLMQNIRAEFKGMDRCESNGDSKYSESNPMRLFQLIVNVSFRCCTFQDCHHFYWFFNYASRRFLFAL